MSRYLRIAAVVALTGCSHGKPGQTPPSPVPAATTLPAEAPAAPSQTLTDEVAPKPKPGQRTEWTVKEDSYAVASVARSTRAALGVVQWSSDADRADVFSSAMTMRTADDHSIAIRSTSDGKSSQIVVESDLSPAQHEFLVAAFKAKWKDYATERDEQRRAAAEQLRQQNEASNNK